MIALSHRTFFPYNLPDHVVMADSRSVDSLIETTGLFFDRHWNDEAKSPPPRWSEPWEFKGGIPARDRPGCYALLSDEVVYYIGVAAGNGVAGYEEHALGTRLSRVWRLHSTKYRLEDGTHRYEPAPKWDQVDGIKTIGFPPDYGYLAHALEAFLIFELKPERNVIGK